MSVGRFWVRKPSHARLLDAATRQFASGDFAECRAGCEEVLAAQPENVEAMELLGRLDLSINAPESAISYFERVLRADATRNTVRRDLARAYEMAGDPARAAQILRQACEADPHDGNAWISLASTYSQCGQFAEAEDALLKCIDSNADVASAIIALGVVRLKRADWSGAAAAFEAALALEPESVPVTRHLAFVHEVSGNCESADRLLGRAISLGEGNAALYTQASRVALRCGDRQRAIGLASQAIEIDASCAEAYYQMGCAYWDLGDGAKASRSFRAAFECDAEYASARWAFAMSGLQDLEACGGEARARQFSDQLEFLERWLTEDRMRRTIDAVGRFTPFFLAYIEQDNRTLLSRFGDLCTAIVGTQPGVPGNRVAVTSTRLRASPLRVGIVSGHLHNHSVWHAIVKGWFVEIDKSLFDLYAYSLKPGSDDESRIAIAHAAKFVQFDSRDPGDWARAIAEDDLDFLIYPEIGMNGIALQLACRRLAPVQLASWGHPETTGLSTIDYYLSAAALEPPGSQSYYRERLVTLPGIGVCFAPPMAVAAPSIDVGAFGLTAGRPIALCPGTPFKYTPEHDYLFIEIARSVPACQMVLFHDDRDSLGALLHRRLEVAFKHASLQMKDHVVVIPWLDASRWQGLLARATVMLDTAGFSGFNTAAQAIASNIPVIAWEGRFLRGRFASGILRHMGLDELVAESATEYVALVRRLCLDVDDRQCLVHKIAERKGRLFEDRQAIRGLERFLLEKSGR